MLIKFAAAAGLVVAAVGLVPAASAFAASAPTSRIYSPSQKSCLDVSTTNPSAGFYDTYGHACDGARTQAFAFHALSGTPVGTYEIVNRSSGQCLDQYRFGIRQQSCTGSAAADPSNVQWTLRQLGTSGHRYQMVVTSTLGTSSPRCVQVSPRPIGYPGPLFTLTTCAANRPTQVVSLTTAP